MQRIYPLESLRGLAALVVVVHHFDAQVWQQVDSSTWIVRNRLVENATLMVDLFFVLSGFVISLTYAGRLSTGRDLVRFQLRRFWRLYPLHLVTLLAFVALEGLKFFGSPLTPPFSSNDGVALLHNLALTQFSLDRLTFNYPSWSISTEFYTYFVFAAVAVLARRHLVPAAVIIVVAAGLWLSLGEYPPPAGPLLLGRCLYSFFIGVLAFRFSRPGLPALPLLIASLVAVCYARGDLQLAVPWLFALSIVALATGPDTATYRFLSRPSLVFLGTISYSVYMMHALVWAALKQGLITTGARLDGREQLLLLVVGMAVLIGVSTLTYRLIEDRFRSGLSRR